MTVLNQSNEFKKCELTQPHKLKHSNRIHKKGKIKLTLLELNYKHSYKYM